jgi:NAD-dependent dihydropyrimidine dehydrogenase PreA subunit
MSHIIGNRCVGVKDTGCIKACPVDCIYETLEQMFINPDECIDCGICISACPVEAIWDSEDMAIQMGEEAAVHKNYNNFNLKYESI